MSPFPGKCMDILILMPSSIPPEHSKLYPRPYHPDCKWQFWNSDFLKELESKLLEPSSGPGMQGSLSEFVELTTERKSLIFQELTCKRLEKLKPRNNILICSLSIVTYDILVLISKTEKRVVTSKDVTNQGESRTYIFFKKSVEIILWPIKVQYEHDVICCLIQ